MVWAKARQGAGKPRGTGTQAQAINPGKAKLIAAVDKEIGEQCSEMAVKLVKDFLAGKATSMKVLCALADELINCENLAVVSELCTYALTLKTEQQVSADTTDEEAERKLDAAAG
jgi:hypothetical protein